MHIERELFEEIISCDYGVFQVQNLQDKPAAWRPREELMLKFESKGSLEAKILPPQQTSVFGAWVA